MGREGSGSLGFPGYQERSYDDRQGGASGGGTGGGYREYRGASDALNDETFGVRWVLLSGSVTQREPCRMPVSLMTIAMLYIVQ